MWSYTFYTESPSYTLPYSVTDNIIVNNYYYYGCFADASFRAMTEFGSGFSVLDCISTCSSNAYKLAGLQYYDQCFC